MTNAIEKRWPAEADRELWRLYLEGWSYSALATRFQRDESAVRWRVKGFQSMGGPRDRRPPPITERRRCLCCQRFFPSEHNGNRICAGCKTTEAFA